MFELSKELKKKKKKEEKPINKTEKKKMAKMIVVFALDNKISRRRSFRVTNVTDWENKIMLSSFNVY